MFDFDFHIQLPLLSRFALAFGLAILLPVLMKRIGLAQTPVANMIMGGTILTDIAAMLVLVLVVATCVVGPILSERCARRIVRNGMPATGPSS